MKATIGLEEFGHGMTQLAPRRRTGQMVVTLPGIGSFIPGRTPIPPWVAEITNGQRKYLRGQRDYRTAELNMNRGVKLFFVLESGHVYEIKENLSWGKSRRYFATVSEEGEIVELTASEVRSWLKANAPSASTS